MSATLACGEERVYAGEVGCLFTFCTQEHMEGARPGDRAYIHSMLQNPDKNTRPCELLRFDDTRARWMVRILIDRKSVV